MKIALEGATCKECLQVQKEGSRKSKHYNIKAIANALRSQLDRSQGGKYGKN